MNPTNIPEDIAKVSNCRGPNCGAKLWWKLHPKTGKLHPFDGPEDGAKSHFSTCPDSHQFRPIKKPKETT